MGACIGVQWLFFLRDDPSLEKILEEVRPTVLKGLTMKSKIKLNLDEYFKFFKGTKETNFFAAGF
jgi:hypothetical protein